MWRGAASPGLSAGQTLPSGLILPTPTLQSPTITGTVTASQVTGIERVLAQWGVPVILASSGSMANNGAVSGMTALPATYSGGAWLYLPSDAIQAGSAAGFYWFVASSTTAGTVYNSTFAGAGIPGAGTATPFVSTGPGAFTGVATGEITAATVSIPAGAMGPNGSFWTNYWVTNNTAAGNKILRVKFGATTLISSTLSTTAASFGVGNVRNLGTAALQTAGGLTWAASSPLGNNPTFPAENTANAISLVYTLEKATATNHVILHGATVLLVYGA